MADLANLRDEMASRRAWLQMVVQADQSLARALEVFCLSTNQELAAAAGYLALGLDPRDAPKFGWGKLTSSPGVNVTQVQTPVPEPASAKAWPAARPPSPAAGGWLKPAILGAAGTGLLGLVVWAASSHWSPSVPAPAPPTKFGPAEIEVRWWVGPDGKVQTQVVPIK